MIYEIMNREDAAAATEVNKAPDTAIISITDYGSEFNRGVLGIEVVVKGRINEYYG